MYEIITTCGKARRARLETPHGVIETPVFMNVGTAAAILLMAAGGFLVARHFSGTESLCLDDLYSVPVCLGDK